MFRPRVIPSLLLRGRGLVKTVKFKDPRYLGDPRNVVKIFNEKEVDELVLLDITATAEGRRPDFELIHEIVSEAFMPLGYGGGLTSVEDCQRVLAVGVEKVVLNTQAVADPSFVSRAAARFGSQSVVVSIDVRRTLLGRYNVRTVKQPKGAGLDPVEFAVEMEQRGAGEILLNSVDRDGTMGGYDLRLVKAVSEAVSVPVVACGGAGSHEDLRRVVQEGGASAAAAGSLFVFIGKHRAVLISFPEPAVLQQLF